MARSKRTGRAYAVRNRLLKAMGYPNYRAYLCSPLWKAIRAKVWARRGFVCTACGGRATQLHHTSYARDVLIGVGTGLDHIVPICRGCHKSIEFTVNGAKRDVHEVNKALRKLRGFNRSTPKRAGPKCVRISPYSRTSTGRFAPV